MVAEEYGQVAHFHQSSSSVGQFRVKGIKNDAVVKDPAKVGEKRSGGGVFFTGDARFQLADIYRVDNVRFVERKLGHIDRKQERMRIGHRFDSIHGERQHVRQPVAADCARLFGRIAHGNAFGARPLRAGRRLLLDAPRVKGAWAMYTFNNLTELKWRIDIKIANRFEIRSK